jgi:hypothetical protein
MGWNVISPLFLGKIPTGIHALRQAEGPPKVYVFRNWQGAVSSAAAGEHVIQAFGSVAALSHYFGGHMSFGRPVSSNEFLGVWGNRNASRFRRILHTKLGELEIVHAKPPSRHAGSSLTGRRLTAAERRDFERTFAENA